MWKCQMTSSGEGEVQVCLVAGAWSSVMALLRGCFAVAEHRASPSGWALVLLPALSKGPAVGAGGVGDVVDRS